MKKWIGLLLCGCLAGCTQTSSPETASALNRLERDYTIEEISLPEEILPLSKEKLDEGLFQTIQIEQLHGTLFRVYTLQTKWGSQASVVAVHDYDLDSKQITSVEYDSDDLIRFWSAAGDENGNFYEFADKQTGSSIMYNGESIDNTLHHPQFYPVSTFAQINENFYQFTENKPNEEINEWKLYELKGDQAEVIYRYEATDDSTLIIPPYSGNRNHMAWFIAEGNKSSLHLFDGQDFEEYALPMIPDTVVVVNNHIYLFLENEEYEEIYELNRETGECLRLNNYDKKIGRIYQINDHEFYTTVDSGDSSEQLIVCQADQELACRVIEEFPSSVARVFCIDDQRDFVISDDRYFLIHWQEA